jgi:mitogen-activated protein kinase 1/3
VKQEIDESTAMMQELKLG